MTKYLLLHISDKLYFTNFNSATQELQELPTLEGEHDDLAQLIESFCSQLTSNFEAYIFSDTLTLHSVDLSKQAPTSNPALIEQFLYFELENLVDLLPDDPVLKFKKDKEHIYHCLLTDNKLIHELKNQCAKFGGKLAYLGHPAALMSSKTNSVEIYANTIFCQGSKEKVYFDIDSSIPTEYESVQQWLSQRAITNPEIHNLANRSIVALEGDISLTTIESIKSKDLIKKLRSQLKFVPLINLKSKPRNLKKSLPVLISFLLSLFIFAYSLMSNLAIKQDLENQITKKKQKQTELKSKNQSLRDEFKEIPELEKQIAELHYNQIVLKNVEFWPRLLGNIAEAIDENSQLTKIETDNKDVVTLEGLTLSVLKIQGFIETLEQDEKLNIQISDKKIKQELINDHKIWKFKISLRRRS